MNKASMKLKQESPLLLLSDWMMWWWVKLGASGDMMASSEWCGGNFVEWWMDDILSWESWGLIDAHSVWLWKVKITFELYVAHEWLTDWLTGFLLVNWLIVRRNIRRLFYPRRRTQERVEMPFILIPLLCICRQIKQILCRRFFFICLRYINISSRKQRIQDLS